MLSKEVKVGLLALISGIILYFGFDFLKGVDFLSSTHSYYAVYDEVGGLQTSNSVMINGFVVGRVSSIQILQKENNKILVGMDIEKSIQMGEGTEAVLTDASLLGGKVIDLKIKRNNKVLNPNDTLISVMEKPLTEVMQEKALPIVHDLDTTFARINRLLKEYEGMGKDVKSTMANANKASAEAVAMLEKNKASISAMIRDFTQISSSLKQMTQDVKPLMGKMNSLMDSLNAIETGAMSQDARKLLGSLQETVDAINQANGSLGLLIHSDSLHTNLNKTLVDLDAILVEMNDNPGKYIPFKKDKRKKKDR